ncbi:MAG: ABC transporter ATP-binding protein [Acidobacteria bacterium]|nr:ABC transporter ATP-binding protein [Acidobacteriota bacterium]
MLIAKGIAKSYETEAGIVPVLSDVNLELARGDAISIMGPSGSGKSSLLHILGVLDPPTEGEYTFDGVEPWTLEEREQARFRNKEIGFVFQDHCLLPQCTVLENVMSPYIVGERDEAAEERARTLISRAGLTERIQHFPSQLSGGEKQRVAIVRAMIRQPRLLLCDEPTGNLDQQTAWQVLTLLAEMRQELNCILMIVTHSPDIAGEFSRQYTVRDRKLVRTV